MKKALPIRALAPAVALAVSAVVAAPSVATAATPAPPQACSKQEKYVTDYWWIKTEVCLTKDSAGQPVIRFWAECQEYTTNMIGTWSWFYQGCYADPRYVLSKDGEVIDENLYGDNRFHTSNTSSRSFGYECQGNGVYTVTADFSTYAGSVDRDATQTFTVSARGC